MTTIHTVPKTLYIHTHGCQMNVYDSDKIAAVLYQSHRLQRVDSEMDADVLLLNTCSIREKAQEKVFSQLGVWKALRHRDGARPIIGVGGCVASQEGEAIRKRAPYVDLIFGPQTLHRLPVMLDTVLRERRHAVDVSFPQIEKFDNLPAPRADGPSAYVSIQEGCSKYCSFCVVPYTRGEEVSRPLNQVLSEIKALADQNVKEITLLGQNVNAWRGIISDSSRDTADLALLIECIADIAGIERIRFLTSHPLEFDDRLIDVYISTPKLVSHLHLPVQHGSDRILAAMKRGHTVDTYLHIIERLRAVRPDISISSDFIVGFPGETDQDFDQTMQLIDLVRFDKSFSFLYSPRPGTPATMLVDETPIEVKKRRLQQLQQKLDGYVKQYSEQMVGTIQRVLVERHAHTGNELLAGRCENMRIVNFIGNPMLIGHYVDVRITMAMPNSLQGELL